MVEVAAFATGADATPPPATFTETPSTDQIERHLGQALIVAPRPAIFKRNVLAFDEACVSQSLTKPGHPACVGTRRSAMKKSHYRN